VSNERRCPAPAWTGTLCGRIGGLDPARNFEFLIDGEEALFVRENAVQGNVGETTNEDKEPDKFHVGAGKNLSAKIDVDDENGPYQKALQRKCGLRGSNANLNLPHQEKGANVPTTTVARTTMLFVISRENWDIPNAARYDSEDSENRLRVNHPQSELLHSFPA